MGLFGNMFEKKICSVCGEEIKLLGNRKLEDGNLCKNCTNKLSPWFSERRHSTVDSIKEQISYREANQMAVNNFRPTRTIGEHYKLYIDDNNRKFTVSSSNNLMEANPDILDFSQASGIDLKIDENRRELKRTVDGKQVSYIPPKYEYSYTFKATIFVSGNPYFDDMEFSISNGSVNTGEHNMSNSVVNTGWSVSSSFGTDRNLEKYYKYINIGNEMKEAIESMRMQAGAQSQAFRSQDAALIQATENMRRVEELKAIAATGNQEQLQAYLNGQQSFQPQMNGMQPGQQQSFQPQQQFQPQSAPQMNTASVTCPYCGSVMTPTSDGHCAVCSAPLS
ncbi:MAG: DUF4428 domain-containing protein [Lachnospiraceae bacterium]|nr:DUF4428 domain-containing protein [Lachnospiraceae bacterium]